MHYTNVTYLPYFSLRKPSTLQYFFLFVTLSFPNFNMRCNTWKKCFWSCHLFSKKFIENDLFKEIVEFGVFFKNCISFHNFRAQNLWLVAFYFLLVSPSHCQTKFWISVHFLRFFTFFFNFLRLIAQYGLKK